MAKQILQFTFRGTKYHMKPIDCTLLFIYMPAKKM